MNFTKELPTRPGFYAWREDEFGPPRATLVFEFDHELVIRHGQRVVDMGGEWCRLVPAEELDLAWQECNRKWFPRGVDIDENWLNSRAKRVMEGEE